MLNNRINIMVMLAGLILLSATAVFGQIVYDQPVSGSSRIIYSHWEIETADDTVKLNQFVVPIGGFIPIKDNLEARFFTSSVSNKLDESGSEYKVSGLGDLRLQINQSLSNDRLLFSLGLNLPTGKKKLNLSDEWPVMEYLAKDYLGLPVRRLGEGFGVNLLAGAAAQSGETQFGASVSYQYNGTYEAYEDGGDYNPGDMFSLSVGADHSVNRWRLSPRIVFASFSTDKLDDEKIYKAGQQLNLQLGAIYESEVYGIASYLNYIIRGRNTRYDSTEAIFDQLKIYGNEFAFNGAVSWSPAEKWYIGPMVELRFIGANEYDFGKSNILGFGSTFGRRFTPDFDLNIGFEYYTGSADGGDIDINGYKLSVGLLAAFR